MKKTPLIIALAVAIYFLTMNTKSFSRPTKSGHTRNCDPMGCGHFGASRGNRKHDGEDYVTAPGESILAPISGKITRIAYPYANDLSFKGIEIKGTTHTAKLFYMNPTAIIGAHVRAGEVVGVAQNIAGKHGNGMINHVHVEIIENATGRKIALSKLA